MKHNLLNHSLSREGVYDDVDRSEDDDEDNGSILGLDYIKKVFDWFASIGSSSSTSFANDTTLVTTEVEELSNTTSSSSASMVRTSMVSVTSCQVTSLAAAVILVAVHR